MLHDVAIVGAGPIGAAFALALRDSELDVVVLDARPPGATVRGDRTLALSHGTRLILERCGVWAPLAAMPDAVTPIAVVDVSQAGGFGASTLSADLVDLPALGYVVSYRALQAAVDVTLALSGVDVRHGHAVDSVSGTGAYAAVTLASAAEGVASDPVLARLAVVADGGGTSVPGIARRRVDYRQSAIVAKVWRGAPQDGVAFERFTPAGPIALLPEGDHYGLVWTMTPQRAEVALAQDESEFLAALTKAFGARIGRFEKVEDRRVFPLALEYAPTTIGLRHVVIGNAAQMLHPVAGQGFNLGLRDAYGLAQVLLDAPDREAIGSRAMLERYARSRRPDRWAGIAMTDGLVRLFGNDRPWLSWPRGIALTLLDIVPPAKRALTRVMLHGVR